MAERKSGILFTDNSLRKEVEDMFKQLKEWGCTDATMTDATYIIANKSKMGFLAKFQIMDLMRKRRGLL